MDENWKQFPNNYLSISDDDLCSECYFLNYNPGDRSLCRIEWPGHFNDDGYCEHCDKFRRLEDSRCEHCGAPAEYHSDMILCPTCLEYLQSPLQSHPLQDTDETPS